MDKIKDDSKLKRETNLDRHGLSSLRPIPNVCHLPDPLGSNYRLPLRGFDWLVSEHEVLDCE